MPRDSLAFLRTGARSVRAAAADIRRNLTSGILKARCVSSDVVMIRAYKRGRYSFGGGTLGIPPLKIPRGLRLSLAQDVWLSIPSKSGGNYYKSVSENPAST